MKLVIRTLAILSLMLVPSLAAVAQSTPDADSNGMTPFAFGMDAPATSIDELGNPSMSITITDIERRWQDHDELDAPQPGMEYVQVSLSITSHGELDGIVAPYTILMVDSTGQVMYMGYIYDNPDIWVDDVTIPAGETLEGSMIFEINPELEPLALVWQPDFNSFVIIHLGDE